LALANNPRLPLAVGLGAAEKIAAPRELSNTAGRLTATVAHALLARSRDGGEAGQVFTRLAYVVGLGGFDRCALPLIETAWERGVPLRAIAAHYRWSDQADKHMPLWLPKEVVALMLDFAHRAAGDSLRLLAELSCGIGDLPTELGLLRTLADRGLDVPALLAAVSETGYRPQGPQNILTPKAQRDSDDVARGGFVRGLLARPGLSAADGKAIADWLLCKDRNRWGGRQGGTIDDARAALAALSNRRLADSAELARYDDRFELLKSLLS
jgi:hypothetical protein